VALGPFQGQAEVKGEKETTGRGGVPKPLNSGGGEEFIGKKGPIGDGGWVDPLLLRREVFKGSGWVGAGPFS